MRIVIGEGYGNKAENYVSALATIAFARCISYFNKSVQTKNTPPPQKKKNQQQQQQKTAHNFSTIIKKEQQRYDYRG